MDSNENRDEQIRAQMDQIDAEIAEQQSLVGQLLPIDSLISEYLTSDTIYQVKIKDLNSKYKFLRKTRGDGNCFFRAFVFNYLEKLLNNKKEIDNFKAKLKEYNEELIKLGYCKFTVDDFFDTFTDTLSKINTEITTDEQLNTELNLPGVFDYIVVCLRLVVSCYLQLNSILYEGFIEGYATIKDFCAHEVEPMYRESDHIHVLSLTNALNVPIRIVYMDRTDQEHLTIHNFPEDKEPLLHILYRPGHYDILYE